MDATVYRLQLCVDEVDTAQETVTYGSEVGLSKLASWIPNNN